MKTFVKMFKILSLTTTLSHISRVQKLGPRPTALAFPYPRLGQKPAQAKRSGLAWPGFFWLGLAQLLASGQSRHITIHCMLLFYFVFHYSLQGVFLFPFLFILFILLLLLS